jgi:23S rRNA pseudouridine1911/1915/1917 synthase
MQQSRRTRGRPFDVIEESEEWIVLDKPSHVQVHPSKPSDLFTLWHGVRELLAFELANGGQVSIINRLDRETSGLTLVCKTSEAARHFCQLMETRQTRKEYLAVVWGWPEDDRFRVDAPIIRQGEVAASRIYLKRCVHAKGAEALTEFVVEERFGSEKAGRFSLVRAKPLTGRTHQIRVHLSSAGYPLVGDKIYGPDEGWYLRFIETGWTAEMQEALLLPRHALHSCLLQAGEHCWQSPLPTDLREFREARG